MLFLEVRVNLKVITSIGDNGEDDPLRSIEIVIGLLERECERYRTLGWHDSDYAAPGLGGCITGTTSPDLGRVNCYFLKTQRFITACLVTFVIIPGHNATANCQGIKIRIRDRHRHRITRFCDGTMSDVGSAREADRNCGRCQGWCGGRRGVRRRPSGARDGRGSRRVAGCGCACKDLMILGIAAASM